ASTAPGSFAAPDSLAAIATQLQAGRDAFAAVVAFIVERAATDPVAVYAGGVAYLKLAGIVLAGWQLARAALVVYPETGEARGGENDGAAAASPGSHAAPERFAAVKLATARFFAEQILPQASALRVAIVTARGGEGVWGLADELC
ncbi:MAG: acyl-CoA dehydrogenase C-terminal domain-containing protein, partial [Janthinobacterium lividum]